MGRLRRRRRSRGQWLPVIGSLTGDADLGPSAGIFLALTVPSNGDPILGVTRIVPNDYPEQSPFTGTTQESLTLVAGTDWLCKRILGQVFIDRGALRTDDPPTQSAAVVVNAGFFVSRRGDNYPAAVGNNTDAPIGFNADILPHNLANYGPDRPETTTAPWMWRRTWILGYPDGLYTVSGATFQSEALYPDNNTRGPGDLRSGTQIDVKTRRKVHQDEDLYFIIQAQNWPRANRTPLGDAPTDDSDVNISIWPRVFGVPMRHHNRSTF